MPDIPLLNLELMKNPLNWLVVLLMVVTAALMIELIRGAFVSASTMNKENA